MNRPLVLASTSRYRAELLRRLGCAFETDAPRVDESPQPAEPPALRAERLALAKASAVAPRWPGALVIGSDQVAALGEHVLDKPETAERAIQQLTASSCRVVVFHTALCLFDVASGTPAMYVDRTSVVFRPLSAAEIARYVAREQPLDCAGSFKCEGVGISLFERIDSGDPTALIGLPLIALARMLRAHGIALP